MYKFIRIDKLQIYRKKILKFELNYSKNISKYFSNNIMYVIYDKHIEDVNNSILYITAVSSLINCAWTIGADIYVEELDKKYLDSLENVKSVFKRWYPKLPFSTKIHVDNIVSNSFNNERCGLLFSGGVDSTFSYLRHRNEMPILITILGADIPIKKKKFWRDVKNRIEEYASREGAEIRFIKTNIRQLLNEGLLKKEYWRYLRSFSWWGGFSHGIVQLSLCAPLSCVDQMGTIFIASTHWPDVKYIRWGSHPLIDNKVSWANVKVVNDGYDFSRQEKIKYLSNYIKSSGSHPSLRVCSSQFFDFNCSRCEKCLRTIVGLVLENIDPLECGFKLHENFFNRLRQNLVKGKLKLDDIGIVHWRSIQENIPEKLNHNLYNSKEFFNWLKNYKIQNHPRIGNIGTHINSCLYHFYYRFPDKIQELILKYKHDYYDHLRAR